MLSDTLIDIWNDNLNDNHVCNSSYYNEITITLIITRNRHAN